MKSPCLEGVKFKRRNDPLTTLSPTAGNKKAGIGVEVYSKILSFRCNIVSNLCVILSVIVYWWLGALCNNV